VCPLWEDGYLIFKKCNAIDCLVFHVLLIDIFTTGLWRIKLVPISGKSVIDFLQCIRSMNFPPPK